MTQSKPKTSVSFDPSQDKVIPDSSFYQQREKEELKRLWYTREELMESCNEAKQIVKMIQLVGGKLEAIDHSRHCVVGLEKYHEKKEREKYRKMLIKSVLIRQEMNRGLGLGSENGCLSEISQMMSASFKDFALWQAAMHEFHAYGSTKPSDSLLVGGLKRHDHGLEACESISQAPKRRRILDRSSNVSTETISNVAVAPNVQNQKSLRNDMMKVMGGYVERKRLRSEVCNLVGAQFAGNESW
mmetsp:Transcript_18763/g.30243  ORF Transcript_18763/g.30243 Transcript_18763/m.30243 type:complete len:243 (+) Transcript_18763:408-1136(+)